MGGHKGVTSDLTELRRRLSGVTAELSHFLNSSEAVFLSVGGALAGVEQEARQLLDTVASAPPLDMDNLSARLRDQFQMAAEHLSASKKRLEEAAHGLEPVLRGIDRLSLFQSEFQRMATTLWALAISINIENTRCGDEHSGFGTVVSDVRRLGALIEPKFEAVLKHSEGIRESAHEAIRRSRDYVKTQGCDTDCMLRTINESLDGITEIAASGAKLTQVAHQSSTSVVNSVGSVLLAIQEHDITRQMIEHVMEGLSQYETDLGGGPVAEPARALAEAFQLCRLLHAQLQKARRRFTGALTSMETGLEAINSMATQLAETTGNLAGTQENGFFHTVEMGIEQAAHQLHAHAENRQASAVALGRASSTLQGMGSFIRAIEGIGEQIKIIALNAQVEAEKTGNEGRALASLAKAIREVSIEVHGLTLSVSRILTEMVREGADTTIAMSDGSAIVAELGAVVGQLRQRHQDLLTLTGLLRDGAHAVRGKVEVLVPRLAEQRRAVRTLAALELELSNVGREAEALAGPARADSHRLLEFAQRYTMEDERSTHNQVISGSAMPTPDSASAPSALGDNVELF
jgi:methyl-accepting chemotaxis protein